MVVAFDLCDINTLATAKTWYQEAMSAADDPVVFLVGMKKDMLVSAVSHLQMKGYAVICVGTDTFGKFAELSVQDTDRLNSCHGKEWNDLPL